jgi:hypothetical protein
MTPDLPHGVDDVFANFLRDDLKVLVAQTMEVLGCVDPVQ